MKKTVLTIIMAILLAADLFATPTPQDSLTRGIQINGFIKDYCILSVTTINANENSAIGVPFDIMGNDVDYKGADSHLGREIARWSFATNSSKANLKFEATPLVNGGTAVDYYLTFRCEYVGYEDSAEPKTITRFFTVSSNNSPPCEVIIENKFGEDYELPIISTDQDVRIMLGTRDGEIDRKYKDTEKTAWPVGFYSSTVTITLSGS